MKQAEALEYFDSTTRPSITAGAALTSYLETRSRLQTVMNTVQVAICERISAATVNNESEGCSQSVLQAQHAAPPPAQATPGNANRQEFVAAATEIADIVEPLAANVAPTGRTVQTTVVNCCNRVSSLVNHIIQLVWQVATQPSSSGGLSAAALQQQERIELLEARLNSLLISVGMNEQQEVVAAPAAAPVERQTQSQKPLLSESQQHEVSSVDNEQLQVLKAFRVYNRKMTGALQQAEGVHQLRASHEVSSTYSIRYWYVTMLVNCSSLLDCWLGMCISYNAA